MSKIRHRLQLKDLHATSIAKFLFCETYVDILEGGSETTVPLFNSNIVLLLFRLFSYDSFTMCCCFTAGILTRVITASAFGIPGVFLNSSSTSNCQRNCPRSIEESKKGNRNGDAVILIVYLYKILNFKRV